MALWVASREEDHEEGLYSTVRSWADTVVTVIQVRGKTY